MKKRLLLLVIGVALFPLFLSAQSINLYRVSIDSLVSVMKNNGGGNIFFMEDSTSRFTLKCEKADLLIKSEKILQENGFTISKIGGNTFILKDIGLSTSLPTLFFANNVKEEKSDYLNAFNEEAAIASFQNKVYHIGRADNLSSSTAYLNGIVRDVRTGEPIVGVSVYDEKTKSYSQTDEYGAYKILLPTGENTIKLSGYSLEDIQLKLMIYENGSLDIVMKEKVFSLTEATVSSESTNSRRSNTMGVEIVRIGRIKKVPAVFGEADVLKIILTLPGVKSVGEASGGFNVRGGATDQNLILFNDGTIYNPTHLFGLFSSFNPDVVTDVELYKSSIPAEYGGRISSVLEIRGREGNAKKITGSAGIGLLTGRAHLEGPIGEKTRFILGARTTYSDWMLGLLPEKSGYNNGTASFYDANASISHYIDDNNTIYGYGYYSRDAFKFNADTSYNYNNINASLKWRSNFSDKHSLVMTAGYDQYDYNTKDKGNDVSAYNLKFGIMQGFLKMTFKSVISASHTLTYGINSIYYNLRPGTLSPEGELSKIMPKVLDTEKALETALFVSDTWNITDKFSADLGIRYSNLFRFAPFKYYGGPEFRVSGKYLINNKMTLKAGFNSMKQYIHMLSNTTSMSPTDIWKMSDENILPQNGWQAAMALYSSHFDNKVEISVEAYYKRLRNYLDYKSGAVLIMNENIAEDVIRTIGKAYGAELMIKKPLGKLNGWLSYTYSRTMLKEKDNTSSIAINKGNWYPAPYDKPHDVKFVGNYKFTHRYSISLNVDYSTGRPVTLPIGKYVYGDGYRLVFSDRNQYRVPDYFRMDFAVNIEPSHNLTLLTHFSLTFGVYNITGRKNPYSVYYSSNGGMVIKGYMLTIFGAPIPYININMKF